MKKILKSKFLLIFIVLFVCSIICTSVTFGADNTDVFFQSHNKSGERNVGYVYINVENNFFPIEKVVRTNRQGTVEKGDNKNEMLFYLKNGKNYTSFDSSLYNEVCSLPEFSALDKRYIGVLPSDEKKYNELMWVLNNIANVNDEAAMENLLKKASLDKNIFKNFSINNHTQDESEIDTVEAIEQAAIYYYANEDKEYTPSVNSNFWISKNEYDKKINITEGYKQQQDAVDKLYKYLINIAEQEVKNGYKYVPNAQDAVDFNKSNAEVIEKDSYRLIGPYSITKNISESSFTVDIYGDNQELSNIEIVGENQVDRLQGDSITSKILSNGDKKFYVMVQNTSSISNIEIRVNVQYYKKSINLYMPTANKVNTVKPIIIIRNDDQKNVQSDRKDIAKPKFDLALRMFIKAVNGKSTDAKREPTVTQKELNDFSQDKSSLDNGMTLVKSQNKSPVTVNTGDTVLYTIRVYNEGQIDGTASKILDYIPDGMEFISPDESDVNKENKWSIVNNNSKIVESSVLSEKNIKAFSSTKNNDKLDIDYQDLQIELKITGITQTTDTMLDNIAEIGEESNSDNAKDRDSSCSNINQNQLKDYNPGTSTEGKGYEDDDDYDVAVINGKYFDLALRSFISQVIGIDGKTSSYKREPKVDVEPLLNGKTTANYKGSKGPVGVKIGDSIVYTIRVYNEGQIEGYADEIVAHLPEELEYVNDDFNAENGWIIDKTDETQRTLKTSKLSMQNDVDNKIEQFDSENSKISYKDIQLKLKIKSTTSTMKEITLISEITKSSNSSNLLDRDNKVTVSRPSDAELSKYKGNVENKQELSDENYFYKGQEDDDDFEKVILQKFDFALIAFATGLNDKKITDRNPKIDISKFETVVDDKTVTTCEYNNKKDTINVCQNDSIELTIRVYNEGTQDGYISEVKGTLTDGVMFDIDNSLNKKYMWKMLDENGAETDDNTKAKYIVSDFYKKENGDTANLIKAYNKAQMGVPSYKELKVVFKITEPKEESRDKQIRFEISKARDINNGEVSDIDSVPNEWNDGEDDQDYENIHIKTFDLKLDQRIESTIIIEDGKEKTNKVKTDKNENVVKIEIDKQQLENVVIKFKYIITVTNEGEIEGYVNEISNYIPDGLKFNQADNPGWSEKANKIVVTNALKDDSILPGKSSKVTLVLTWINDESNMKLMKNTAEISDASNISQTKDIDSTPNNKAENEDDIKTVEATITSTAGANKQLYVVSVVITLIVIGGGIFLIKRFVL